MAKIVWQNVPLSATPIDAQGRETAVAWVVKEGGPEGVGFRSRFCTRKGGHVCGRTPSIALLFTLSRRGADGHRLADG